MKLNQYDPLEIIDMDDSETMKRNKSEFVEAIQDLVEDSGQRFGTTIEAQTTGTKKELNLTLWITAEQYVRNERSFWALTNE